jgi:hypothetical protein
MAALTAHGLPVFGAASPFLSHDGLPAFTGGLRWDGLPVFGLPTSSIAASYARARAIRAQQHLLIR